MQSINAAALIELYTQGQPFAFLDIREEWLYCQGFALLSSSCPLSSLDISIVDLVPNKSALIVLVGNDLAGDVRRACERLSQNGYSNVGFLEGGLDAWCKNGKTLFTGIHAFSKLLGEYIEHERLTPSISAEELLSEQTSHKALLLIDVRPEDEFRKATIPGAINIPAGDLLRVLGDGNSLQADHVVVHCGGRTRGIVAAELLRTAGFRRRVSVLENGTIGWRLAGNETTTGVSKKWEIVIDGSCHKSMARKLLEHSGVSWMTGKELESVEQQQKTVPTYFIDLRSKNEFDTGHYPGARNISPGQLIQEADRFIGIRNARIVLFDDDGDRAAFAAYWLKIAGWVDVLLFSYTFASSPFILIENSVGMRGALVCQAISAMDLYRDYRRQNVMLLDLSLSTAYEKGHIPGAWFAMRSKLQENVDDISEQNVDIVVLTCENGMRAILTSAELVPKLGKKLRVLLGGNAAWRHMGLPEVAGCERMMHPAHDVRRSIYDNPTDINKAMQGYIDWEVGLMDAAKSERYLPWLK